MVHVESMPTEKAKGMPTECRGRRIAQEVRRRIKAPVRQSAQGCANAIRRADLFRPWRLVNGTSGLDDTRVRNGRQADVPRSPASGQITRGFLARTVSSSAMRACVAIRLTISRAAFRSARRGMLLKRPEQLQSFFGGKTLAPGYANARPAVSITAAAMVAHGCPQLYGPNCESDPFTSTDRQVMARNRSSAAVAIVVSAKGLLAIQLIPATQQTSKIVEIDCTQTITPARAARRPCSGADHRVPR